MKHATLRVLSGFVVSIYRSFDSHSLTLILGFIAFCTATAEKAKHFRDHFRSQAPALYNPARELEAPIPPTTPSIENVNVDVIHNQLQEVTEQNGNNEPNDEQIHERNDQELREQNDLDELNDATINGQNEEIETKPELSPPTIILNESDSLAVDNVFGDDDEQLHIAVAENETTFYENGALKVLRKYGSLEMIYTHGENPVPMPPERFVVKRDDVISKNYPFEENVSGIKIQIRRKISLNNIFNRKMVIVATQFKLVIDSKKFIYQFVSLLA